MQPRGRNGWWLLERPKLALRITGQREKRVFERGMMITWIKLKGFNDRVVTSIAELQENTEALKTKMSELRLYCDLLLQQVNKIKEDDELVDPAEVRIKFEWQGEIREAPVVCVTTAWDKWYAVLLTCVSFSDWRRHWKHGEVHMCYFPKDTGGMYANSKPYVQSRCGDAESTRIAAGSRCQTAKGFSKHFCFSWHNPATILVKKNHCSS